jgi:ketosteroid isomerase-like protein
MIDAAERRKLCACRSRIGAETFPFGAKTSVFKVAGEVFAHRLNAPDILRAPPRDGPATSRPGSPAGCRARDTARAMSQENVGHVRDAYERWKATRELDLSLVHPEVEWVFIDLEGKPLTYRGHEGLHEWLRDVGESWEDLWWEPQRLTDVGDQVVAIVTAHLRGRGSGIDLEVPLGNLWTFRDGLAVHFKMFLNPDEALEAAGLSE